MPLLQNHPFNYFSCEITKQRRIEGDPTPLLNSESHPDIPSPGALKCALGSFILINILETQSRPPPHTFLPELQKSLPEENA